MDKNNLYYSDYKEFFEDVPCNLCGTKERDTIYQSIRMDFKKESMSEIFRSSGDELLHDPLVKCKKCGLEYVSPRIKGDLIVSSYADGIDTVFLQNQEERVYTFSRELNKLNRYFKCPGKVFDVGTAGGAFLKAAFEMGWNVSGCEPNQAMCRFVKEKYDYNINCGTLFECNLEADAFDMVTLWDVLEHVPNPIEVLKECARILKKDGIIVINNPDRTSWIARILGRKWPFLSTVHIYYFNKQTLSIYANRVNMEIIEVRPFYQYLKVGYILSRAEGIIGMPAQLASKAVNIFKFQKIPIPYFLGQYLLILRKK